MYRFYSQCVSWPKSDIQGLIALVDRAITISRQTFLKHVHSHDLREIERLLGYVEHPSQGLTMAGDGYVTYHRSKLHGETVYYFCHSAIEYVFRQ
jgi:hypothetical protein